MLIIERYILREIFKTYLLAIAATFALLITGRLLQLARYFFQSFISPSDILLLVLFAVPKLSLYALPLATVLSISLVFSRMKADRELTALEANGISALNLYKPVLAFAFVNMALAATSSIILLPHSNALFRKKLNSLGAASASTLLREGIFIDIIPGFIFYFQKVDTAKLTAMGVFIEDARNPKLNVRIIAEKARLFYDKKHRGITFSVTNGTITRLTSNRNSRGRVVFFKKYEIRIPLGKLIDRSHAGGGKNEMTMEELKKAAKTSGPKEARRFLMEYNLRIALPLSCICLGFLTQIVTYIGKLGSVLWGMSLSAAIYLSYYFLISMGKGLAENGLLPPTVAVWFPLCLIATIIIIFWFRQRSTET
ncbi:MAG TPA: YjgP/YjgQ family permease [Thermodesulforhabdus norvegica]|uniref:YjgP/YjgQ family permease n=1 Tax=Thermodesulforhabdus norvegica TaxID=39841 RepID=A0A7C0WV80_9BACT|nr:YjgP/YjgQ family permease [Thermodesulforhabdus norvegica]